MGFLSTILTRPLHGIEPNRTNTVHVSNKLLDSAHLESTILLNQLNTSLAGLSQEEYEARLEQFGPNVVAREKRQSPMLRLLDNIKNPLVILLSALGLISYFTADVSGAIVIAIIVLLGLVLRFFQEQRADNAAEKLKAMVNTTASVLRNGNRQEVPLHELVPGDIVQLSAGDMIPADVRILNAKDLFINQAALTGESLPVEKISTFHDLKVSNALEIRILVFWAPTLK